MRNYSDDPKGHFEDLLENVKTNWEKKFGTPFQPVFLAQALRWQIREEVDGFYQNALAHLAGRKAEGFLGFLESVVAQSLPSEVLEVGTTTEESKTGRKRKGRPKKVAPEPNPAV